VNVEHTAAEAGMMHDCMYTLTETDMTLPHVIEEYRYMLSPRDTAIQVSHPTTIPVIAELTHGNDGGRPIKINAHLMRIATAIRM
jgi:hypothetical protein